MHDLKRRGGGATDELKRHDERISELRDKVNEQRKLIGRMRESLKDVLTDSGRWMWATPARCSMLRQPSGPQRMM